MKKVTDVKFRFVGCKNEVCISFIDMYWCVLARRFILKKKENKEVDKYSLSGTKHIEIHDTKRYHHFQDVFLLWLRRKFACKRYGVRLNCGKISCYLPFGVYLNEITSFYATDISRMSTFTYHSRTSSNNTYHNKQ
jgi:hypothetical protein